MRQNEFYHIKTSLERCIIEGLASELGRAKEAVKGKINEIRESERVENLSNYASWKKRRFQNKVKRKINGGV